VNRYTFIIPEHLLISRVAPPASSLSGEVGDIFDFRGKKGAGRSQRGSRSGVANARSVKQYAGFSRSAGAYFGDDSTASLSRSVLVASCSCFLIFIRGLGTSEQFVLCALRARRAIRLRMTREDFKTKLCPTRADRSWFALRRSSRRSLEKISILIIRTHGRIMEDPFRHQRNQEDRIIL
jgi:hypothetical protein